MSADPEREETLPAWSLPDDAVARIGVQATWPEKVTREWAWGGSQGEGVRVCILDSGVEPGHPAVGELEGAVAVSVDEDGATLVEEDAEGDLCGHGTACAGIVRSLAPGCRLFSVRVLGSGYTGSGPVLVAGLRWAVEQGFDVVNMSLSTTKSQFVGVLHELADSAYFRRSILVASAHNMPVESYPWRFSSVLSVGTHERPNPLEFFYNPNPRVLRPRRRRRGGLAGGDAHPRDRQQLRDAAHERDLRARPREAPRAHPVPAQERPLAGRDELRGPAVSEDRLLAAVAAGVLPSEDRYRALLRSIVETARAIFGARASSVFLLDEAADELVFEATAGDGPDLVGTRFPSSTGIAGWVLVTRQPLVVEDVQGDPRFAREAAESTGYVPRGLMAVPLVHEERTLGVLSVLDRPKQSKFSLAEMELLGQFGAQAALALEVLLRGRRARSALDGAGEDLGLVARVAAHIDALPEERREAGLRLLGELEAVLRP